MIRSTLLMMILAVTGLAQAGERLSVDQIVERHIQARGGYAKIKAIKTLVYSGGTYREENYESPGNAFMAFKRPFLRVVGNPDSPGGFTEGYDGSSWEWFANPGVVLRTVGPASGAARRGVDFEGRLIDFRQKGSTITQGDDRTFGDRPVYVLTVTTRDGFKRHYYIDRETFLIIGEKRSAPFHAFGDPVTSETAVSDYRRVAGVLFPYRFMEIDLATGKELTSMQWGVLEANRQLADSWFSPPVFARNQLQSLIENLYFGRDDSNAQLWTYAMFRRAYPDVDTREAVEFVGYHMQKMGNNTQAGTLLEANLRDYKSSSSAAFALGRAHKSAGHKQKARTLYQRAVVLDPKNKRAVKSLAALGPN